MKIMILGLLRKVFNNRCLGMTYKHLVQNQLDLFMSEWKKKRNKPWLRGLH